MTTGQLVSAPSLPVGTPAPTSSLGHLPNGERWAFDEPVTAVFEDMLQRSIPQYEVMRATVFDVARTFVTPKSTIVDLGCSRGDALKPFLDAFGAYNTYVGCEISDPMLEATRERFRHWISCGLLSVDKLDLRTAFPKRQASVILAVLTLQFVPIEYRQRIIQDVYDHLQPGGAFLLVEKVLGANAKLDRLFVDQYLTLKADHGYTQEEIARKRLSLEGVLVPVTAKWNEELLLQAGFRQVDCIWRWLNFAAWVAVK